MAGLVLNGGGAEVDACAYAAIGWIAEIGPDVDRRWKAVLRRNTAVGDTLVAEELVAERDPRLFGDGPGESGVDGVAFETDEAAEAV